MADVRMGILVGMSSASQHCLRYIFDEEGDRLSFIEPSANPSHE
jgi:hypothetical protein